MGRWFVLMIYTPIGKVCFPKLSYIKQDFCMFSSKYQFGDMMSFEFKPHRVRFFGYRDKEFPKFIFI